MERPGTKIVDCNCLSRQESGLHWLATRTDYSDWYWDEVSPWIVALWFCEVWWKTGAGMKLMRSCCCDTMEITWRHCSRFFMKSSTCSAEMVGGVEDDGWDGVTIGDRTINSGEVTVVGIWGETIMVELVPISIGSSRAKSESGHSLGRCMWGWRRLFLNRHCRIRDYRFGIKINESGGIWSVMDLTRWKRSKSSSRWKGRFNNMQCNGHSGKLMYLEFLLHIWTNLGPSGVSWVDALFRFLQKWLDILRYIFRMFYRDWRGFFSRFYCFEIIENVPILLPRNSPYPTANFSVEIIFTDIKQKWMNREIISGNMHQPEIARTMRDTKPN